MDSLWLHIALLLALLALLACVPPDRLWARLLAVACLEVYAIRYYVWRATETMPPFELTMPSMWQWSFFGVESLATLFLCWTAVIVTRQSDNTPLADIREKALRAMETVPKVTVLIPTYLEPIDVLRRTIEAATRIDYPRFEVVVLDDEKFPRPSSRERRSLVRRALAAARRVVRAMLGLRPGRAQDASSVPVHVHADLAALCRRLGVRYLRRSDSAGAKAGNLNHGLANTDGEVILVLDADFHARPNILWRTVGLLDDETALVQTPQHYYSPDPIQHNLGGGKAFTEEQRFFFDTSIPARDAWANAICVGTSFIVRRDALGKGFEVGCLSEDVYGGYALVSRGWRVRYLNECLSYGAAADSVVEYVRQRTRWAKGIIQAIGLPYGPLRAPKLSLMDRLLYLEMPLYWISQYVLLAMVVIAPGVYFWTGVPVFESTIDAARAYVVPRVLVSALVTCWISRGKVMPLVTDIAKLVGLFYILGAIVAALVNPRGQPFDPTRKGLARDGVIVNWDIIWPFLLIAVFIAVGLVRNLLGDGPVAWDEFLVGNVLLALYSMTLLLLTCLVCVDWPKAAMTIDYDQPLQGNVWRVLRVLFGPWRR